MVSTRRMTVKRCNWLIENLKPLKTQKTFDFKTGSVEYQ